MSRTRHILLVDDHPIVHEGLRILLARHPDLSIVGACPTPESASAFLQTHMPDLIIMDISMNGTNGLVATRHLTAAFPAIPILIFTCHDEMISAPAAFSVGARGLVRKDQPEDEIVHAIRTVLNGQIYQSPQLEKRWRIQSCRLPHRLSPPIRASLSKKEQQILDLLAEGLTTARIALALDISVKTVETHRLNIRRKLEIDSQTDLVRWAIYRRTKEIDD